MESEYLVSIMELFKRREGIEGRKIEKRREYRIMRYEQPGE